MIKSEYVDMDAFRRDYPMTEEDLFRGSAKNFVTPDVLDGLVNTPDADKEIIYWLELRNENGVDAAEVLQSDLERLARAHKGHALYVGIDEAKDIDATVMTVLKDRRADLHGGVKGISIDTTRGDFLADWFERNTSYYIKRTKFSRPSKSLMYSNLQVVISDGATSIPPYKEGKEWVSDEARHFQTQMIYLEKELIGNLLVVHHPEGACNRNDHNYDECPYHDDYPDSWMLAEDIYLDLNGAPVRKKKPMIPTVPNSIKSLLDKPFNAQTRYGKSSYE